jgi:hypothetical protein
MIYKQIEESDKVFGRSQKISSGSFTSGFQLLNMHIDERELTSELTKYVQSGSGQTDDDSDLLSLNADELSSSGDLVSATDYTNFNSKFLIDGYLPNVDVTNNYHDAHWSNVQFGDYYANVYNEEPVIGEIENENAEVQFTTTYGNKFGYGSRVGTKTSSVTKAIYSQYKNLLLGPGDDSFTFTSDNASLSGIDRDSIFVINMASTTLKEKLDEGNLEFTLSLNAHFSYTENGQEDKIEKTFTQTFRDDSRFGGAVSSVTGRPKVEKSFNIIKGTLADGTPIESDNYATGTGTGAGEGFGLIYPDLGIIILNPYALSCEFGTRIETWYDEWYTTTKTDIFPTRDGNCGRVLSWYGSVDQNSTTSEQSDDVKFGIERNHQNFLKMFYMLKLGGDVKSRSSELIPSKHYFIRVRNTDFNYSNNPTFIYQHKEARQLSQSEGMPLEYFTGKLRFDSFANDPKTYVTTIGLYNDNNELVAVAKLSVPVLKSFDTETLIKVKLDF